MRWQALVLIALTTVKVFVYDTSQLDHIYRIISFVALGMLLLAIYLILVGIMTLVHIAIPVIVTGILALVAGILILIGR